MSQTSQAGNMPVSVESVSRPEPVSIPLRQRNDNLLKRQQALVTLGRRAIVPPQLPILMQDAANLLAEMLDTESSGVAELSPDGKSLQLRLVLGKTDASDACMLVHTTGTAATDSLAGYALHAAQPVVVDNLAQERRFVDVFLRDHGFQSAVAVPLHLDQRPFGSLASYSSREHNFDHEDILFVEAIAHLVTTTIARRQAEIALADQRCLADGVFQTVDALVLVLNCQCEILRMNPAGERITGFSLKEIQGRSIWKVLSADEEMGGFQAFVDKLQEQASPVEYESHLLTKQSQRRLIAWSFSALPSRAGIPESIIATGIDITGQREAEYKAERAEEAAEQIRRAMSNLAVAGNGGPEETSHTSTREEPALGAAFSRSPILIPLERRKYPRRSYPYSQSIAPVVDGQMPGQNEFAEVQCNDIAASGFSFLSATPPASDMLVVALGVPPRITYLTAQVVHITRVEHNGQRAFRIGCNYVSRAEY